MTDSTPVATPGNKPNRNSDSAGSNQQRQTIAEHLGLIEALLYQTQRSQLDAAYYEKLCNKLRELHALLRARQARNVLAGFDADATPPELAKDAERPNGKEETEEEVKA